MKITNQDGTTFETKIIHTGDKYGRNDCLTNDGETMIEFYDTRYDQFVTRYNVTTLLGTDGWGGDGTYPYGLDMDGHVPAWKLSADNMTNVISLLKTL